jgi:hypothetical protein
VLGNKSLESEIIGFLQKARDNENYPDGGALAKPEMVRTAAKTVAHEGLCSRRPFWLKLAFGFAELAEMARICNPCLPFCSVPVPFSLVHLPSANSQS